MTTLEDKIAAEVKEQFPRLREDRIREIVREVMEKEKEDE